MTESSERASSKSVWMESFATITFCSVSFVCSPSLMTEAKDRTIRVMAMKAKEMISAVVSFIRYFNVTVSNISN